MKPWKWIKNHPAEAMAIAAGLAVTGGVASGALLGAGAAGAGAAGAGAVAGDAFLPAALGAGGAGGLTAAEIAAGGGEAVSGAAASHLAGAATGEAVSGAAAPFAQSALLGSFPAPSSVAGAGAEASLFDPAQLANPQTAMGPRESTWLSRMTPEKQMRLGLMAAQMAGVGGGGQPGGPQPVPTQPSMRPAVRSQEEITKAWLRINDPQTYARIYGNPPPQQGVA